MSEDTKEIRLCGYDIDNKYVEEIIEVPVNVKITNVSKHKYKRLVGDDGRMSNVHYSGL